MIAILASMAAGLAYLASVLVASRRVYSYLRAYVIDQYASGKWWCLDGPVTAFELKAQPWVTGDALAIGVFWPLAVIAWLGVVIVARPVVRRVARYLYSAREVGIS